MDFRTRPGNKTAGRAVFLIGLSATSDARLYLMTVSTPWEEALSVAADERERFQLWPQRKRRASLRIVAMVSIGAMRVAMEAWRQDGGKRPLAMYLRESFATLEAEI
jgi:hypothetical protein